MTKKFVEWDDCPDNKWFETDLPLHIACCGCGLTHTFEVRKGQKRGVYEFRITRDNRTTAALRRHRYHPEAAEVARKDREKKQ